MCWYNLLSVIGVRRLWAARVASEAGLRELGEVSWNGSLYSLVFDHLSGVS